MADWRNFYLQKMGMTSGNPYPLKESVSSWGVWCSEIPFVIYGKTKDIAKRTWPDEHGDDEYIPSGGACLEAYTMKVKFGCKKMNTMADGNTSISAVSDVRKNVGKFLEYLRSSGMMMMYSSHTRIGRQYVRLQDVSENAKWKSKDGQEFLVFEVTFKVNDPMTDVKIVNNHLVIDSSSSD